MPKDIETHRFRVFCEVDVEQLGPSLVRLDAMGFKNIGHELITDVANYKNRQRVVHDIAAKDFAMAWIEQNPTFRVKMLQAYFKENNRAATTANYAISQLVADKFLVKLGEGNYRRADMKTLQSPETISTRRRRRSDSPQYYDISNQDLIWRHLKSRKKFKISEIKTLFRANDRPSNSSTSLVSQLVGAGFLKKLGVGEYQVLKKPAATKIARKRASTAASNSTPPPAPAAEEAPHGE